MLEECGISRVVRMSGFEIVTAMLVNTPTTTVISDSLHVPHPPNETTHVQAMNEIKSKVKK